MAAHAGGGRGVTTGCNGTAAARSEMMRAVIGAENSGGLDDKFDHEILEVVSNGGGDDAYSRSARNGYAFDGFEAPRVSQSQLETQETPKVTTARLEGLRFLVTPDGRRYSGNGGLVSEGRGVSEGIGGSGEGDSDLLRSSAVRGKDDAYNDASGPTGGLSLENEKNRSRDGPEASPKLYPGQESLGSINRSNGGAEGMGPMTAADAEIMEFTSKPAASNEVIAREASGTASESVARQPQAVESTEPERRQVPLIEEPAASVLSGAVQPVVDHNDNSMYSANASAPPAANTGFVNEGEAAEFDNGNSSHLGTNSVGSDVVRSLPETEKESQRPESFAFRIAGPPKEMVTSSSENILSLSATSKPSKMFTKKWRGPTDDDLRKMVMIPEYLGRDMANAIASEGTAMPVGPPSGAEVEAPAYPLIVFINSKSGGRLGPQLMKHFVDLISPNQVYDLSSTKPSTVLRHVVGCLDRMANSGDNCAQQTWENLRILVAGGDGTVGWVLSSVGELRVLSPSGTVPPVGVIPLGTGNDMSRSFGWGGGFSSTSKPSLKRCIIKAMSAKAAPLDTWQAVVVPSSNIAARDIRFPHALQPQQHIPLSSTVVSEMHERNEASAAFKGLFFNYLSIGMDAQVAYGFHHLRDEKPWLARGRLANQMIYSSFGCTQGWFCTSCSAAPSARGLKNNVKIFIKKRGATLKDWEEVHVPSNIRAIVILNLPNYAGGRNPWGKPSSATRQQKGLGDQNPDDGVVEVLGLRDGWHTAFVMLTVRTAVRLCQAEAIRLELRGNARSKAYLQMDGEPWKQPLGQSNGEPTVLTIEKLPSPSMLLKR